MQKVDLLELKNSVMCSKCRKSEAELKRLVKNVLGNPDYTLEEKLTAAGNAADNFAEFMEFVNMQTMYDTALQFGIKPVDFLLAFEERKSELADEAMQAKKKQMGVDSDNPIDLIKALIRKLEN